MVNGTSETISSEVIFACKYDMTTTHTPLNHPHFDMLTFKQL